MNATRSHRQHLAVAVQLRISSILPGQKDLIIRATKDVPLEALKAWSEILTILDSRNEE